MPGAPPARHRLISVFKAVLISSAIAGVLLVVAELALALCGVRPASYEEDPYVGFSSQFPLFLERTESDGHSVMATAENKLDLFNAQEFAAQKPSDTYRVFCVGGSTTYGRPYDDATSFCGWLRAMLPRAVPSHTWDVVNAGGISYASYRVSRLMEELAGYSPDLFIVYTGHNEFLEERTYRPLAETSALARELRAVLARTRLYSIAGSLAAAVGIKDRPARAPSLMLPGEVEAILDRTVGPASYHRDDALQQQVLDHFRFNLNRMIDIGRSARARVILISPASNLRHCAPFKSQHREGLDDEEEQRWSALLAQGRDAYNSGEHDTALQLLREAEVTDGRHAQLQYLLGKVLWELGRRQEAKAAFVCARDEDICPLRALSAMRRIVKEVAQERAVPLVDFASWTEGQSTHGTPGKDLFLDHVHPTIETHRQLALMLLDTMSQEGLVQVSNSWDEAAIAAVKDEVEGRLDQSAHAVALRNQAKVLGWAGKFEDALQLASRAARMNPADAEAHYHLAENAALLGRTDEAVRSYREAIRVRPDYALAHLKLGNCLSEEGKTEEALQHYNRLLSAGPEYAALGHNNIGNELQARGNIDEAIRHYRDAIQLNPSYVEAHSNLGLALAGRGEYETAIACYREALALEPENATAHFNLGLALSAQGLPAKAAPHYRHAVEHMPDYAPAHYRLAEALAETGAIREALGCLREAVRLQPNYAAALADLARLLATCPDSSLRDPAQAIRLAERACELTHHQDTGCLDVLAAAYQAGGQPDRADRAAQAARALAAQE